MNSAGRYTAGLLCCGGGCCCPAHRERERRRGREREKEGEKEREREMWKDVEGQEGSPAQPHLQREIAFTERGKMYMCVCVCVCVCL